jgi:hypothetical protein
MAWSEILLNVRLLTDGSGAAGAGRLRLRPAARKGEESVRR